MIVRINHYPPRSTGGAGAQSGPKELVKPIYPGCYSQGKHTKAAPRLDELDGFSKYTGRTQ